MGNVVLQLKALIDARLATLTLLSDNTTPANQQAIKDLDDEVIEAVTRMVYGGD